MAKFGVDQIRYEFLNSMAKFGTKFLDCGQGELRHRKLNHRLFIC